MRYLSDEDLGALGIGPRDVIAAIEAVLRGIEDGDVSVAPKSAVIAPDGRYMMATLAAADGPGVIAVKSVMVNDRNKARGLPGINGAILLLDAETGALRAVMDAGWVTAVRTAGLSAVAATRLAAPDAAVLGLVGAGVQAESHLRAFADLFPLREVRVFGRSAGGVEKTCALARDLGLAARAAPDPRAALDGADLVVTSVTLDYSIQPFLDAAWLKPGAFAAITDLGIPWHDASMVAFQTVVVDDLIQEKAMAKPMVDPALIAGDLRDLVHGRVTAGRPAAFIFRGIAAGDLAVASLALDRAGEAHGNP